MPDRMVEDARNVSINLHGEHGKYVMMQLFFSDKWMLISEITFISSEYKIIFIFRLGHDSHVIISKEGVVYLYKKKGISSWVK